MIEDEDRCHVCGWHGDDEGEDGNPPATWSQAMHYRTGKPVCGSCEAKGGGEGSKKCIQCGGDLEAGHDCFAGPNGNPVESPSLKTSMLEKENKELKETLGRVREENTSLHFEVTCANRKIHQMKEVVRSYAKKYREASTDEGLSHISMKKMASLADVIDRIEAELGSVDRPCDRCGNEHAGPCSSGVV